MTRPIHTPADRKDVFRAIANPIRRKMIARLMHGPRTARTLADLADVTSPAVTQHLNVLRETGLVSARRKGKAVVYAINRGRLAHVARWLKQIGGTAA